MSDLLKPLAERYSSQAGTGHSRPATINQGPFQDTKSLVGKKRSLRTSNQLKTGEVIQLPVFDPNFRRKHIPCRYPGCNASNPDPAELKSYGHGTKRDLYLCPTHMGAMKGRIENLFQKAGVMMPPYQRADLEDLSGYISWIPKLEQIYREALQGNWSQTPSKAVREAVLNVRNFLIITNLLLNPNGGNLDAVLPPVLGLLVWIIEDAERTRQFLIVLQGVIQEILAFFRISYNWINLGIPENPGAAIGAGIGGFVGMFGGMVFGPLGVAGMGAGGAVFGGLIGGGIEALFARPPPRHDFEFEGNAEGDLIMNIR